MESREFEVIVVEINQKATDRAMDPLRSLSSDLVSTIQSLCIHKELA